MNQMTTVQKCTQFIQSLESQFTSLTAEQESSLQFKKEAQFAIQELQKSDFLADVAMKNPTSLRNAILNIASIGLTLNPVEKKAYLVPRSGGNGKPRVVCLDVSYVGLIDIAVATGMIEFCHAKVVRENDEFSYLGTQREPVHDFQPFGSRGKIIGVYCLAKTSTGSFLTEMMSVDAVNLIRARSEAFKKGYGPWVSDYEEMMKKTVIKMAAKTWPKNNKSKALDVAIGALNEHEGIDFKSEQEAQDSKKKEAYEQKIKEAQEKTEEKYKIIENIQKTSAEITRDYDDDQKFAFLTDVLECKGSFRELRNKSNETLSKIYENLKDMM